MEMPIDLTIDSKFGTRYNFHIPNNWFVKKTSATVLPPGFNPEILKATGS